MKKSLGDPATVGVEEKFLKKDVAPKERNETIVFGVLQRRRSKEMGGRELLAKGK